MQTHMTNIATSFWNANLRRHGIDVDTRWYGANMGEVCAGKTEEEI